MKPVTKAKDPKNDEDNIRLIVQFYRHARDHTGTFEFAFVMGIFDAPGHYGMGGHTGVVVSTKNGNNYVKGLKIDFGDSGILVGNYNWVKWSPEWTDNRDPKAASYAFWYHSISRNQIIAVLAEAAHQVQNPHGYNMLGLVPGKKYGQNCATYAVKLARYAGFTFEIARILGSSAKPLHFWLMLRKPVTYWKVKYRPKSVQKK